MSEENTVKIGGQDFVLTLVNVTPRPTKKDAAPKPYDVVVPLGLDNPDTVGALVTALLKEAEELKPGGAAGLAHKFLFSHLEDAYQAVADETGGFEDDEYVKALASVRQKGGMTTEEILQAYKEAAEELEFLYPFNNERDPVVAAQKLAAVGLTIDDSIRRETAARAKIRALMAASTQITEKKAARAKKNAEEEAKEASDPVYKAKRDAERAEAKAKAAERKAAKATKK